MKIENYSQALCYIMSALPMYQRIGGAAYKANLNNTDALMNYLDNPHKHFNTIHVAGTNGKGSVSHCIASILQEAGYKTALYTSPHLIDFRERIKVNGEIINKKYITNFINKHHQFLSDNMLSFFEMSVGLAFEYFAHKKIDVAVVEVGMGGRLDSTNVINPDLSIITNISLDHTAFLGDNIEKIAVEKAGIIKPFTPILIGETQSKIDHIFINKAKENNSEFVFADKLAKSKIIDHKLIPPLLKINISSQKQYEILSPLVGTYQLKNLKTIVVAAEIISKIGYSVSKKHIQKGIKNVIKNTGLQGRWSVSNCKPYIIMDTGHNIAGIKYISDMLKSLYFGKLHIVLGMVDDKNHGELLSLMPKDAIYYISKPSVPRGFDAEKLLEKALSFNLNAKVFKSVKYALKAAKKAASNSDLIFVGGSTFTVADAMN